MRYVLIGKIVNTHALKGEVRIISNFEYKDRVFKKDNSLYIGKEKIKEVIETYRHHKIYDMVKFVNINTINDVLKYKGLDVYFLESDLELKEDELLEMDIVGMKVYLNDKLIGQITEYRNDSGNKIIKINNKFIPFNKNFITKVQKNDKIVYMHDIEVFL